MEAAPAQVGLVVSVPMIGADALYWTQLSLPVTLAVELRLVGHGTFCKPSTEVIHVLRYLTSFCGLRLISFLDSFSTSREPLEVNQLVFRRLLLWLRRRYGKLFKLNLLQFRQCWSPRPILIIGSHRRRQLVVL